MISAFEHGSHVDDRRVLTGIIYFNHNGLRWCDAPAVYGPHKTFYNRWKRWSDKVSLPGRLPVWLRSGSEFITSKVRDWIAAISTKTGHIEPG